jgi:NAD(P)-dependent dehydrogenase (short-subunit alcohol dehydrogenase family)
MTLAGKRALVTGGGTGVGAGIALALADAGAEVWISGRSEAALKATAERHSGLRWAEADVTGEASVAALVDTAGPLDIVVANAGQAASAPFRRTTLGDWDALIAVNLTGTFLTFREGLRRMNPGWGRLIAVASIAGLRGEPYIAPYTAAKHGVVGLCRALAKEVAKQGITVNAICPGYIDTPMTDRTVANIVEKTGKTEAESRDWLARTSPAGRMVRPEEVAATALWLCSEGAQMVNGQAIALTGGET